MGRASRTAILLVGMILLGSCSIFYDASKRLDRFNQQVEPIYIALDCYYDDHKYFPENLKDLTPKYLRDYTVYLHGIESWEYERESVDSKLSGYTFIIKDELTGSVRFKIWSGYNTETICIGVPAPIYFMEPRVAKFIP